MISFDTFYIYYLSNLTNLFNLGIRVNIVKQNMYMRTCAVIVMY
jgi:hypothetical protein